MRPEDAEHFRDAAPGFRTFEGVEHGVKVIVFEHVWRCSALRRASDGEQLTWSERDYVLRQNPTLLAGSLTESDVATILTAFWGKEYPLGGDAFVDAVGVYHVELTPVGDVATVESYERESADSVHSFADALHRLAIKTPPDRPISGELG
jgi:hypothetical protein